jgi:hypothetical protein
MSNLNNGEYSPEKLWSQLSALSNGPTISGDTPNFKTDWLVLALACGMQLASELGLRDIEGTIHPGNDGTSGEVEVLGNIPYILDGETELVSDIRARLFFDQPDVSVLRWVNGKEGEEGYANFVLAVEPYKSVYSALYDRFAHAPDRESWYVGHHMYKAFWSTHYSTLKSYEGDTNE